MLNKNQLCKVKSPLMEQIFSKSSKALRGTNTAFRHLSLFFRCLGHVLLYRKKYFIFLVFHILKEFRHIYLPLPPQTWLQPFEKLITNDLFYSLYASSLNSIQLLGHKICRKVVIIWIVWKPERYLHLKYMNRRSKCALFFYFCLLSY